MQLPSVRILLTAARRSFLRFPFVLLAGTVAAVAGIIFIDNDDRISIAKLWVSAQLGIPLLFAIAMVAAGGVWQRSRAIALALVGIVLLVGYYLTLPDWMSNVAVVRFLQINIGLHLLVAFIPFVAVAGVDGFWQYNKTLFLKFLTALLYAQVLQWGLSIALVAIDKLFGIDIDPEIYMQMWVFIMFVFNTWMFLGWVPSDVRSLESATDYPKGLKVFSQYILIPLVVVYLAILTTYMGKIVITRVWPSGWIGYLVSSVAVVGILALLLVHPIRERAENKWVATFSRWFYILMLPSIAMLLLAIYKRIAQYGITEMRYILLVLAVWLAGVALYFIFSRGKNIKMIPATLCLVAFATSFGPWSAFGVSKRSQVGRLESLLVRHDVLVEGKIQRAPGDVEFEDRKEISAVLRYLGETHGLGEVTAWFENGLADADSLGDLTEPVKSGTAEIRARAIVTAMDLDYVEKFNRQNESHFSFNVDHRERVFPVEGDYLVKLVTNNVEPYKLPDTGFSLGWDKDSKHITLLTDGEVIMDVSLDDALRGMDTAQARGAAPSALPIEVMRVEAENAQARLVIYVLNVSGLRKDGGFELNHISADCYVDLKELE